MKKAILILTMIVIAIILFLTACSSPKSAFMSSFRDIIKNEQYTAEFKLNPTVISGFSELAMLNPDALKESYLTVKTSRDTPRDLTYNTYGLHIGGAPAMDITAHSYENGNTGKIFVPAADFFQMQAPVRNILDLTTNSVYSSVLASNKNLKEKHFDVLQTLQNATNQVIDQKMVDDQSEQLSAIEKKTAFRLYKELNDLDKTHYQTKDDAITLTLDKQELVHLGDALLDEFQSDEDFLNLYSEVMGLTADGAKKSWSQNLKKTQQWLSDIQQNKAIDLNTKITVHPDADKGMKQLLMTFHYQNKATKQQLDFDFTMELLPVEKIPTAPSNDKIISKREIDKLMTDVIREQRKQ
ncbi:hypothetical protein HCJ57_04845 [Listeria booriae]|uniref:Lmo2079 family surface lipoprotein n=1 Tax=Listeria booriae TaxID=1552123 RepID=UPI001629E695|nr:hypothetical protein [Listeria booriae]MBC2055818.1 hypothetical protein [Listeria booriae]